LTATTFPLTGANISVSALADSISKDFLTRKRAAYLGKFDRYQRAQIFRCMIGDADNALRTL
jgi:hypothetical protein